MKKEDYPKITNEVKYHIEMEHPNIIELIDYQQKINMIYLLLEYAEHGTLYTYLNNERILPAKLIAKLFVQVCQAIQYIHAKGLLHRDIKPENILLDGDLNAKLSDFGLCVDESNIAERSTSAGTYEYMAPELLRKELQGKECDVWALGVLLYELFHNKAPFPGGNTAEVQASMQNEIAFSSHVPQEARDLIKRILVQDQRGRPQIAAILEHDFVKQNYTGSFLSPGPGRKKRGLNLKDQIAQKTSERRIDEFNEYATEYKKAAPTVNDPTKASSNRTIDDVLRGVPSQQNYAPKTPPNLTPPKSTTQEGQFEGPKSSPLSRHLNTNVSQGGTSGVSATHSPTGFSLSPEHPIKDHQTNVYPTYKRQNSAFQITPQSANIHLPPTSQYSNMAVASSRLSESFQNNQQSPVRISHGNLPIPRDYSSPVHAQTWERPQFSPLPPSPVPYMASNPAFTSGIRTSNAINYSNMGGQQIFRHSPLQQNRQLPVNTVQYHQAFSQHTITMPQRTTAAQLVGSPSHTLQGLVSPHHMHSHQVHNPPLTERLAHFI